MTRSVIASGKRFELLHDPESDTTTVRHITSARGTDVTGEDAEMLREDIQGSGSHVDQQLAQIWFIEGYAARATPDEGVSDAPAVHAEDLG